jgi:hypothetical protein
MIEYVFTLDYEIYGNGTGSLMNLVYEPTEKLVKAFGKWNAQFVVFVEVAELELIDNLNTDPAIDLVKQQIRDLYRMGFEIGLHLHPQWYNARNEKGLWHLDYTEYNLCNLPRERIRQLIERSIVYLRHVLRTPDFTPFSFRAGNWLFQPTQTAAEILAEKGIHIDSSVFKGGLLHKHKLDYRRALQNGNYWRFKNNVDIPDPGGVLLELPIYTSMIPTWKILTSKRIGLQRRGKSQAQYRRVGMFNLRDIIRLKYPKKFDFCRLTISELIQMVDAIIREDQQNPAIFRPIVAIGHTKDLTDFQTIDSLLGYLDQKRIKIATFKTLYSKCT